MPSTLVHLAFGGMIAAALLGSAFDRRSLLVVLAVVAAPDLDSFLALAFVAGHRTLLHTYLIPIAAGALLYVDLRVRDRSFVRGRWGPEGVRLAWVSVVALAFAGIGLDFVDHGVNPLWPLHDQFYVLDGRFEVSDQRGIVQSYVDLSPETEQTGPRSRGSSQEVNISTGVDPNPGGEGGGPDPDTVEDPERMFPVVRHGWQLAILVSGTVVTAARLGLGEVEEN
ncbi:metal-dependent hydrolase [Halosimplex pelagicum]|uniref:Metal-dependent hydrolase n=1 Tax=Halosimplex pelagicum TaxID=869886 RepID=A0A7D5PCN4_9EURY|nr:metal-dependent hydrolase [Halosimplex pelagicum]QLH83505.1 metal-dependent hydrolase [Halosimplex pelagicum]